MILQLNCAQLHLFLTVLFDESLAARESMIQFIAKILWSREAHLPERLNKHCGAQLSLSTVLREFRRRYRSISTLTMFIIKNIPGARRYRVS